MQISQRKNISQKVLLKTGRFEWQRAPARDAKAQKELGEFSPLVQQLLFNRGILSRREADLFLNPDFDRDNLDPFLFQDMAKAVKRIFTAIKKGEKIVVHGDYDADGVCASAVLYLTLKKLGAVVEVYIPHRDTEGYGLRLDTVQTLADVGTNLLITVDCGISNAPEVKRASELGMEVIITDHHVEPPEIPAVATALINPHLIKEKYPFKELAGVGVAYKLCQALCLEAGIEKGFIKWLLDLVAISTVGDYVKLLGENRLFVRFGLLVMQKNKRRGLKKLFKFLALDPLAITTETIGFKIVPPLNAAGRIDHANTAFELLVTEDEKQAEKLAKQLMETNKIRQREAEKIYSQAVHLAQEQKDAVVVVVEGKNWPVGLLGIVASRLSEDFLRPCFVLTSTPEGYAGSGRSPEQVDLMKILHSLSGLFTKFGGHPQACGFSLDNVKQLATFRRRVNEETKKIAAVGKIKKILFIEEEISFLDINHKLTNILEKFAPFGEGNERPTFLSWAVKIIQANGVGANNDHLKVTLEQNNVKFKGIAFGLAKNFPIPRPGDLVDIVFNICLNTWQGNTSIELNIIDIIQNPKFKNQN